MEKEICICAAVKTKCGKVIRGHRHADCLNYIFYGNLERLIDKDAQGFVTSKNRFVTRKEGRKLQEEAGIKSVSRDGYCSGTLFSEDLY